MSILHASPPVKAYAAEPYSVSELDDLDTDGRLWATILLAQGAAREAVSAHEEEHAHLEYEQSDVDAAMDEAREQCISDVEQILDSALSDKEKLNKLAELV